MSTASAPYYWLVCDGCGVKSTEDSEYSAWADEESARSMADDSGWLVGFEPVPGVVMDLCEECEPRTGDDDEWAER